MIYYRLWNSERYFRARLLTWRIQSFHARLRIQESESKKGMGDAGLLTSKISGFAACCCVMLSRDLSTGQRDQLGIFIVLSCPLSFPLSASKVYFHPIKFIRANGLLTSRYLNFPSSISSLLYKSATLARNFTVATRGECRVLNTGVFNPRRELFHTELTAIKTLAKELPSRIIY